MLSAPNPLGRANADVVRPFWIGLDVTNRHRDCWIIDFGEMPLAEAALYEMPFEYVRDHVFPLRVSHWEARQQRYWWQLARPATDVFKALSPLGRFIASVIVAKHRLFVWLPAGAHPDHRLVVFAREDDYFFGVLHSRVHEVWSLRTCSWQGKGNDPVYTPKTCFDPFPFPRPTEEQRAAIGEAAERLHEVRQSALDGDTKLTMTGLYNKRPTWLDNLHRDLDEAVFAAYGWPSDFTDEALLERLLALNLERAAEEERGIITPP